MEKFWKAQTIADILDVSLPTAIALLRDGEIPAIPVRTGPRKTTYRIRPEAFAAWFKKRETEAAAR
jgi:excisionase family DNA binding protein